MNKYPFISYIATLFCISLFVWTGICVDAPAASNAEYITDGHFPAWYDSAGVKHSQGYPTETIVLTLPSLTPKQRSVLNKIYKPYAAEFQSRDDQLIELRDQKKRHLAGDPNCTLSIQEYNARIHKLSGEIYATRIKTWSIVKKQLKPEQLQELVDMVQNRAR